MTSKQIFTCISLLLGSGIASAQELNTDLNVTHELVPEEQAAVRLHMLPKVNLPQISRGRLVPVSSPGITSITPYINQLEPAAWLTSLSRTPWRGYASLAYGPAYNLAASAGYRFIENDNLTLGGYLQFDGMSYKSHFPRFEQIYAPKVGLHRNTFLVGADTRWTPAGNHGTLNASLLYQHSGYDFPILDIKSAKVNNTDISANVMKADVAWTGAANEIDYSVGAGYDMIRFAPHAGDYRGRFDGKVLWHASAKSAWGLDLGYNITRSATFGANKGLFHSKVHYDFSLSRFRGSLGLLLDVSTGSGITDASFPNLFLPELKVQWLPGDFFNVWGQFSGRVTDNNRLELYNEQPYLLPDFDAGASRVISVDAGMNVGPWKGASIGLFGGYLATRDWYMPDYITGRMMPMDVRGWHGGVTFGYSYRQYIALDVKAEFAQSPTDRFERGYAYWRDHAGFNLVARASSHPVDGLEITLGYHLRTHRSKITESGHLNLLSVSNLTAGVRYSFTPQWSAFVNGENLLNRRWYLGPSVPSQGIVCMAGVAYKF